MADRPMATAPDRSVAALSTMVILIFLGLAQRAPSNAAPQHAIPPPIRRRSVSTEPSAVVLIGNLNRFRIPFRNLMVHMMESVPLIGMTFAPKGAKSW